MTMQDKLKCVLECVDRFSRRVAESFTSRVDVLLDQAEAFILENCHENIALEDVSQHVNLSPSYLTRLLQQRRDVIHKTPHTGKDGEGATASPRSRYQNISNRQEDRLLQRLLLQQGFQERGRSLTYRIPRILDRKNAYDRSKKV